MTHGLKELAKLLEGANTARALLGEPHLESIEALVPVTPLLLLPLLLLLLPACVGLEAVLLVSGRLSLLAGGVVLGLAVRD